MNRKGLECCGEREASLFFQCGGTLALCKSYCMKKRKEHGGKIYPSWLIPSHFRHLPFTRLSPPLHPTLTRDTPPVCYTYRSINPVRRCFDYYEGKACHLKLYCFAEVQRQAGLITRVLLSISIY